MSCGASPLGRALLSSPGPVLVRPLGLRFDGRLVLEVVQDPIRQ
jgi:hypothetical protein